MTRISISLEDTLASQLDRLARKRRSASRSDFVRELVRQHLVEEQWDADGDVLGTLTLLYDHHQPGLPGKLTRLQHHHHAVVMASTHVHLDHHLCAEMVMMRGRANELRGLADRLRALKGVLHAALAISSTGESLGGNHAHT